MKDCLKRQSFFCNTVLVSVFKLNLSIVWEWDYYLKNTGAGLNEFKLQKKP